MWPGEERGGRGGKGEERKRERSDQEGEEGEKVRKYMEYRVYDKDKEEYLPPLQTGLAGLPGSDRG